MTEPIQQVKIDAAEQSPRGQAVEVQITIANKSGNPIDAVIPVQVEILDANGRPAEFSGHYGAAGGELALSLDLATNATAGMWTIRVKELASGITSNHYLRVSED